MKIVVILYFSLFGIFFTFAQTGTLQIYCEEGVSIYINDQFKGKTKAEMSGLLVEDLMPGEFSVRAYKQGFLSETKTVVIESGKIQECRFELVPENHKNWIAGINVHGGSFGLFNVNSVFTKAKYSFGITPFIDYKLHQNFSLGFELLSMWGKPETNDAARMMMNPNLRLNALFQPFNKTEFSILVASGFAYWPGRTGTSVITPTFNETRMGWDFRAAAGARFSVGINTQIELNFGYWASSSTSDNVVWITHDSMIISAGPVWQF
ncbi:MAG: hypothetical protein IPM77_07480 [Crocinitomicaceae bacterium]|nr:hypothetical protein [Crocinitomicaceae bacterium]